MKFGLRTPSIKRSIKARTTGRAKRALKKAVVPGYGKKGMGWINDPQKAAYNKVYNKTTVGASDLLKSSSSKKIATQKSNHIEYQNTERITEKTKERKKIRIPIGEHKTTFTERIVYTVLHLLLFVLSFFVLAWAFSGWMTAFWGLIIASFIYTLYSIVKIWIQQMTTDYKVVFEDELTLEEGLITKQKK